MSIALRNRILPMTFLVIWSLICGAYLSANQVISQGSVLWFVTLVVSFVLMLCVMRDRRRLGHYHDEQLFALVVVSVTGFIFLQREQYVDNLITMVFFTVSIMLLGRWTIIGVKPSGMYARLTDWSEKYYERKLSQRPLSNIDALFGHDDDATSDDLEPTPAA